MRGEVLPMRRVGSAALAVIGIIAGTVVFDATVSGARSAASAAVSSSVASQPATTAIAGRPGLRAGAAVVDATWHVGASAGQYASNIGTKDITGEWDPNAASTLKRSSYGVASRLSISAVVVQDGKGDPPIALVRDDNYLAQDMLVRRVGQLLAADRSPVTYDHIVLSALHDHSSPYYSTPAAGVWLFQDVADLRMFEYQARQMATAIEHATASMQPAEVGATTVQFAGFQGNIAGADVNEDGSPTGYPLQDNDHGLVVMRFDSLANRSHPRPLATWINYAEHGESLDEYDLISEDWMAPFMRYVTRATHAPMVFSQGSVGSAEGPYEHAYPAGKVPTLTDHGQKFYAIYGHMGFAQAERGAHLLAEHAIAAWKAIGRQQSAGSDAQRRKIHVQVPFQTNPTVRMLTRWYAGPLSHPYPSVGNCRSGPGVGGDPGVPAAGLPDCERVSSVGAPTLPFSKALFENLKAAGLPIPDNYDAPSVGLVEENMRLRLQAVRLGSILLASCACEPQSDVVRNLETRTDRKLHDQWNGFDYAKQKDVDEAWPVGYDNGLPAHHVRACHRKDSSYSCPDPRDPLGVARLTVSNAAFRHMEAEINNSAAGWNATSYVTRAGSEPVNDARIKGNFTHTELGAGKYKSCPGYELPVGLGHTGDYNGYTVSYREYEARDSYRKALTSYGPHTGDYMVTNLVGMAAHLMCGSPVPAQATDPLAAIDELRQQSEATVLGQISSHYFDTWAAHIPNSIGPAHVVHQPRRVVRRFNDATMKWVGGDNWTDDPTVMVQRRVHGQWRRYADQSGEIQVILDRRPALTTAALKELTGRQDWTWTASMEVYDSYPRADIAHGQVPNGRYRFVVHGHIHLSGKPQPYVVTSRTFAVRPWRGIRLRTVRATSRRATFAVGPIRYPRMPKHIPTHLQRYYGDDHGGTGRPNTPVVCITCTFRPWATRGRVTAVVVSVYNRHGQVIKVVHAHHLQGTDKWTTALHLRRGQFARVRAGGVRDSYGETNLRAIPLGQLTRRAGDRSGS